MNGPTLRDASQTRLRRLASWTLPVVFAFLLAAGCYPWGSA